jgi:hypothetical protein
MVVGGKEKPGKDVHNRPGLIHHHLEFIPLHYKLILGHLEFTPYHHRMK